MWRPDYDAARAATDRRPDKSIAFVLSAAPRFTAKVLKFRVALRRYDPPEQCVPLLPKLA